MGTKEHTCRDEHQVAYGRVDHCVVHLTPM